MTTDNTQELDEILAKVSSESFDAAINNPNDYMLVLNAIEVRAKQALLDWHQKEIAEARISENEMYMQEANRHYFPAGMNDPYIPLVQIHERIGELTLKENKEAEL